MKENFCFGISYLILRKITNEKLKMMDIEMSRVANGLCETILMTHWY